MNTDERENRKKESNCLAPCHFEAEGREISEVQQIKVCWLDKVYQSPPFISYLLGKSKVLEISPFGRNDIPEQLLCKNLCSSVD
jgi:hypothetical protein